MSIGQETVRGRWGERLMAAGEWRPVLFIDRRTSHIYLRVDVMYFACRILMVGRVGTSGARTYAARHTVHSTEVGRKGFVPSPPIRLHIYRAKR